MGYLKLFRMLFSATVHNSLVTWEIRRMESDDVKFKINIVQGLLVKHLVHHKVSGHHIGDNTVKRLTECHFLRKILFTEKKWKPVIWCFVYSKHVKTRDSKIYFTGRIVMSLCALMGVLMPNVQGKIIDKMKVDYLLYIVHRNHSNIHLYRTQNTGVT